MNFTKRLIISGGIILASIVLFAAALWYAAGDLNSKASKFVDERATMQAATAALDRLTELNQDAPAAAKYDSAIAALLPQQDKLINVPPAVAAMGTKDGVTASLTFSQGRTSAQSNGADSSAFSLDVRGPLADVASFLSDFETSGGGYLISIGSFDITSDNQGNANLTAQGAVYFDGQ